MGSLSGLQKYQVYVYNCENFNKSAENSPLLEWQDLIDAAVQCTSFGPNKNNLSWLCKNIVQNVYVCMQNTYIIIYIAFLR